MHLNKILFFVYLVIIFLIPCTLSAFQETVRFNHLIEEDIEFSGVMQDDDGFLWIGSDKGLFKYDGRQLISIDTGFSGHHSTPVQDEYKNLWFSTRTNGVIRYNKKTDRLAIYHAGKETPFNLSSNSISSFYQPITCDGNGNIWVCTENGIDRIAILTGVVKNIALEIDGKNIAYTPKSVHVDREGNIWAGTQNKGLLRFDHEKQIFIHFAGMQSGPVYLSDDWILSLFMDSKGVLWVGTKTGGLNRFNRAQKTFENYIHDPEDQSSIGENRVQKIIEDRSGNLWLAHGLAKNIGLSRFDPERKNFTRFLPDPNDPGKISSNYIQDIYQDRTGILWISTGIGHIDTIDPLDQQIGWLKNIPDNENSLSFNPVVGIHEDRSGMMWFGSGNGLNRYDRRTKTFARYMFDPTDPFSIAHPFTPAICEDSNQRFWIGSFDGTMSLFDRKTGKCLKHFVHDPKNSDSISPNKQVRFIIEDRDKKGILWVATYEGGLMKYDIENERFKRISGLQDNNIPTLVDDGNGSLYIPNEKGLDILEKHTGSIIHFNHDPQNPSSISKGNITDVLVDSKERIWVTGTGAGLQQLIKKEKRFVKYNRQNGFPTDDTRSILEDGNGYLWVGSDIGIIRFEPDTADIKIFTTSDGLQGKLFFQTARFRSKDGTLWFAGMNGINYFHPEEIKKNNRPPQVYFTSLTQAGEPIKLGKAPEKVEQIILDWKQNFIEFEFSALNYTKPKKNTYAYFLKGYDKDWYYTETRPFGRYTNLAGGTYDLKIKAANNDGVWSENGQTIRLIVKSPWWSTIWFKLIISLMIFGGFYWRLIDLRRQRKFLKAEVVKKTSQIKEAKDFAENAMEKAQKASQAKSVFLANMSHELRTPLNSILGYSQILKKENRLEKSDMERLDLIHQSGTHLLVLINDLLDISKIEAGKIELNPSVIVINTFLDHIVRLTRTWVSQKELAFDCKVDEKLPSTIVADEVRLRQILINLLNNAVKYTNKGGVTFRVSCVDDKSGNSNADAISICFEIEDTGIGISKSNLEKIFQPFEQVKKSHTNSQGTGLGLAISHQLVSLMGGELIVSSRENKGSVFKFSANFSKHTERSQLPGIQLAHITGYEWEKQRPVRILIADDHILSKKYIADALKSIGFTVSQADDGQQAIEIALKEQPDLILMDLMMTEMDGFEATGIIRTFRHMKDVVIIAISTTNHGKSSQGFIRKEFDAFILKPVEIDRLLETIRSFIGLKWKLAEITYSQTVSNDDPLELPPASTMTILMDLARRGNLRKVKDMADRIRKEHPECEKFSSTLEKLADNFEEIELYKFIEKLMGEGS